MKKLYVFLLALTLAFACLFPAACSNGKNPAQDLQEENLIDDNYDNYYQVFVYSYADSDGNGYGDFKGLTSKLDYIRDMGYTGIWLMPICPATSYHGYDVTDYKAVKAMFGTMDDYKAMLVRAHELGIKVITDLVVNHTSSQHPWFKNWVAEKKNPGTNPEYADYYNYSAKPRTGYSETNGIYYEARFTSSMPDLNLDSEAVRAEIEDIMSFWLEMGTDGFRLDGCLYYYTGNNDKSIDFCRWIKETAVKYNPDAYIVGEMWDGMNTSSLARFYQSGADSFFCFAAHGADGYVNRSVNTKSASTYTASMTRVYEIAGGYIPAPFLDNHDVGRIAGIMGRNADKIKFAYGLLSMYNGNTFTYYGDEIGMIGSANDPDKRIGMLWDNAKTNLTNPPPGYTKAEYVFDGVKEQQADPNSILNYYKLCNNTRNAFPEIMRGTPETVSYSDPNVAIIKKTYNSSTVTIVINLAETAKTVTDIQGELAQDICISGSVSLNGGSLQMPGRSIAIIK